MLRFSFHVIDRVYLQAVHRTRRSMSLPRWMMLWKWRSGGPQAGQVNIGEIVHLQWARRFIEWPACGAMPPSSTQYYD
jgi:hypothetical protein